jgi:hypothetical protein
MIHLDRIENGGGATIKPNCNVPSEIWKEFKKEAVDQGRPANEMLVSLIAWFNEHKAFRVVKS